MNDYFKINEEAYDLLVPYYKIRRDQKSRYEEKPEALANFILRHVSKPLKLIKYLEVGPGSGEILKIFESKNCSTTAIDISKKMINLAKEIAPKTKYFKDNVLHAKFQVNYFDIIYAGALIHLFRSRDAIKIIDNFYSWIKPNGLLFINTTISLNSEEGFLTKEGVKNVMRYRKNWQEKELKETITSRKFKILDIIYTNEVDRNKIWIGILCKKQG